VADILVIEDNPANLELMTYLLKSFGHDVATAEDGDLGLAAARRRRPDAIVCDVQLPGMDGYAVVREVRADASLRAIPVIAVTALAMVGDREKGLATGFNGYIPKPIDPENFVVQIEHFLTVDQRGVTPHQEAESAAVPPDQPRCAKCGTVLVVDDSPTNRELIYQTLTPFGYEVCLASTVAGGLELVAANVPDLVLSDLHMPYENGFDLIRRLRADPRFADVPIILVSSSLWGVKDRETATQLGVTRFLFRPLEPQALINEVARCLTARLEAAHGDDPRR
jgi:two-component system, cell cycle response regulator